MKEKVLNKEGFVGTIYYEAGVNDGVLSSKRHRLKIEKDDKVYINRSNLTLSGAEALFYRWVHKQGIKK